MADGIRIDALDPTVLPNLDHVFPAMLDGMTVKLTIRQIRTLMSGGTDAALALADLSNTTGPRGKLTPFVPAAGDCNNLFENGLWMVENGAANLPPGFGTCALRVEVTNTNRVTQFARGSFSDNEADSKLWKREFNNPTWGPWYRVRENELEIVNLITADPWALQPIGVPIPVFTDLSAALEPPTNKTYRYAKLTAGQAVSSGQYNFGILTGEFVSGSSPTITARANVSLTGSPINGATIRLLNTEGRFIRGGTTSGALQDSANLLHDHPLTDPGHVHNLATYVWNAPATLSWTSGIVNSAQLVSATESAVTGITIGNRGSDEARPRNVTVTYYMRLK